MMDIGWETACFQYICNLTQGQIIISHSSFIIKKPMLFAIGTKVKFRHTDDEGEVKALLEGGMVSVYLPKYDMEIPTFPDDLLRAEQFSKHPVKAKVVEMQQASCLSVFLRPCIIPP